MGTSSWVEGRARRRRVAKGLKCSHAAVDNLTSESDFLARRGSGRCRLGVENGNENTFWWRSSGGTEQRRPKAAAARAGAAAGQRCNAAQADGNHGQPRQRSRLIAMQPGLRRPVNAGRPPHDVVHHPDTNNCRAKLGHAGSKTAVQRAADCNQPGPASPANHRFEPKAVSMS